MNSMGNLHVVDWLVIFVYICGLFLLSYRLSRNQKNVKDYYLAGNKAGPLSIALSTTATQCSTNSLLGAPAFVAFSGGLLWLQYELAVPFAMVALMLVIMPVFRGLNLVSVYTYLEKRYGVTTRTALSVLFQFVRAFSTGVTVYALALVIQHLTGAGFFWSVMLVGAFTVIYDFMGGIRAVIYSDVIQLVVLFSSILLGILIALKAVGGWENIFVLADPETLRTLDWRGHGFGDGRTYSFWPMLFGGFFLYVSYYGCDQTQIQRELSSRSIGHSRMSLFIGGVVRFPLVLAYCFLGVCMAAYMELDPGFGDQLFRSEWIGGEWQQVRDNNLLVPAFVVEFFPLGVLGLFLAGLLAAAMSSLDSTINSLSALTLHDLVERYRRDPLSEKASFWLAKLLTIFWGMVCILFSFTVADISDTVIESVNKIGSLVNGPLLAVFTMGILTRKTHQTGILFGIVAGFIVNLLLWKLVPSISWLWWNPIGFFVTAFLGYGLSCALPSRAVAEGPSGRGLHFSRDNPIFRDGLQKRWLAASALLVAYGIGQIVFLVMIGQ